MKIIIAGAGNVGTHLAKLLSREKQDIILMDDDEEKLSALSANFDLLTVTASPSSISGLKEVGVKEADLFIAVTPDESRNMTACMLATNLGAKKTVARIDNYEYLLPKNKEFFRKLGVDSLIYPEMLAAKEIVSSMRMSWVRQWWEFCGGALILIGTKMREKAEILNIPPPSTGCTGHPLPRGSHQTRNGNHHSARRRCYQTARYCLFHHYTQIYSLYPENSRQGGLCRCTQRHDHGRKPYRRPYRSVRAGLYAGKNCR